MTSNPPKGVLLLLPLPVTAPPSIVCGAVLQDCDQDFNPLSEPQTIWGRLPERFVPSPYYLFAQRIAPAFLRSNQSMAQFIRKIRQRTEDRIVVTWNPEYLYSLDLCAQNCLQRPDITSGMAGIVSLRTATYACNLLGDFEVVPHTSLERTLERVTHKKCAAQTQVQRLVWLRSLALALREKNQRLISYMLRSEDERISLLRKAHESCNVVMTVTIDGKCGLSRAVAENHGAYSMILYYKGNPVTLTHERSDGMMIAPPAVLTPARRARLNYDTARAFNCVFSSRLDNIDFPKAHAVQEDPSLSEADRAYLERCYNENPLPEPDDEVSSVMKERYYMYLGDNERSRASESVYKHYIEVTQRMIKDGARSFAIETEGLLNYLNEANEEDLKLAQLIREYPSSL